jgi:uncharacterized Zn-binding protein involved in type VI secretion
MPNAARVSDSTGHGPPVTPGPGSLTVLIGNMPAWRAIPATVGPAVEAASNSMKSFMSSPQHTPPSATPQLVGISSGLIAAAAAAAAAGNPAGVGAASGAVATMNASNVGLTATWTAACAVPGGAPAATTAYTEGIKALAATAASATFAALPGMSDAHVCSIPCPIPPHGPGMVTQGSTTVKIDNLPPARVGDQVFEACGGANPISVGCTTVNIG